LCYVDRSYTVRVSSWLFLRRAVDVSSKAWFGDVLRLGEEGGDGGTMAETQ